MFENELPKLFEILDFLVDKKKDNFGGFRYMYHLKKPLLNIKTPPLRLKILEILQIFDSGF